MVNNARKKLIISVIADVVLKCGISLFFFFVGNSDEVQVKPPKESLKDLINRSLKDDLYIPPETGQNMPRFQPTSSLHFDVKDSPIFITDHQDQSLQSLNVIKPWNQSRTIKIHTHANTAKDSRSIKNNLFDLLEDYNLNEYDDDYDYNFDGFEDYDYRPKQDVSFEKNTNVKAEKYNHENSEKGFLQKNPDFNPKVVSSVIMDPKPIVDSRSEEDSSPNRNPNLSPNPNANPNPNPNPISAHIRSEIRFSTPVDSESNGWISLKTSDGRLHEFFHV